MSIPLLLNENCASKANKWLPILFYHLVSNIASIRMSSAQFYLELQFFININNFSLCIPVLLAMEEPQISMPSWEYHAPLHIS